MYIDKHYKTIENACSNVVQQIGFVKRFKITASKYSFYMISVSTALNFNNHKNKSVVCTLHFMRQEVIYAVSLLLCSDFYQTATSEKFIIS